MNTRTIAPSHERAEDELSRMKTQANTTYPGTIVFVRGTVVDQHKNHHETN